MNEARAQIHTRILLVLSGVLLSIYFITGGSSQQTGTGVMVAQLLATPIGVYALVLAHARGRLWPARWAIAAMLLIIAVPLAQLLPVPAWLWHLPDARVVLSHDLAQAGVTHIDYRWSLTPATTERDLWLLLPPAALFFTALAVGRTMHPWLLRWILGLIVFSTLLAFVQLGTPQQSIFNPYPQFAPALAGVFANHNHQADALAIGLVLALSMIVQADRGADYARRSHAQTVIGIILVAGFGLVLPLLDSRAGVLIAMVAAAAFLLMSGTLSWRRLNAYRGTRILAVIAVLVLAIGTFGAFAWMRNDADIEGLRWAMATTTWHLGFANAPLGSGIGSFVPMFEQATHGALMHTGYINNAHNDYVQWWFTGGVLGVIALLAALTVLIASARRLLVLRADSQTRATGLAAFAGLLVLLLHSTVDYPLRTPALMATFALLAGVVVGASHRPAKQGSTPPRT